jgi:membrane-bound serine protease (ClpP class)
VIRKLAVLVILTACVALPSQAKSTVGAAKIEGAIDPAVAVYVKRAVEESEAAGHECLVITIDTPGGLSTSMQSICKDLMASRVPTVVYVYPAGAQSMSAGVVILYAAEIAAMAPGTSTGAAHPVFLASSPGGEEATKPDETMEKKVTNAAASYIRSLAKQRGRNVEWAEKAVRESVTVTDDEALQMKIIDVIAPDIPGLLRQIDGREVESGGKHELKTRDAAVVWMEMTLTEKFLHVLAEPNLAYIFMLVAIYGIIYELSSPGAVFPGVVGGIALILALISFSVLSVNVAGIALIVLGVGLLIADAAIPGHGVLTVGGAIAFVIGSFMLFKTTESFMHVSLTLIISVTAVTVAFFAFVVGSGLAHLRRKFDIGFAESVGKTGKARTDITQDDGKIFVYGELWSARTESGTIKKGEEAQVVRFEGFRAIVKRKESGD